MTKYESQVASQEAPATPAARTETGSQAEYTPPQTQPEGLVQTSACSMVDRHRPLANLDRDLILDRIAAGEYVPEIAASLGITKQALAQALARFDKDKYLAARETAAEIRLDEATMAIENAADHVDLARARERFRAVAWRAEREHPSRWAARPNTAVQINGSGEIQVQLVSYASNIAEQQLPADESASQQDT